jgi:hypothetical protein
MLCLALPPLAAAQEVAAPVESVWLAYAKVATESLLPVVLTLVSGAMLILGRYVHRWLAAKLGVEQLIAEEKRDALVRDVIDGGIARSEQRTVQWARERGELPPGPAKLEWALKWIVDELHRRGLPELGRDQLAELVEARLGDPRAPGEADRASAVLYRLRGDDVDRERSTAAARGAVLFAVLACVAPLGGCSTGQLQAHTTAARLARSTLDTTATGIEAACAPAVSERMGRAGVSADDHAEHRDRCTRAAAGHEVTRQSWLGYVDAVLAAASGGRVDLGDILAWAAQLTEAYGAVAELLRELGREPPPLPRELAALGGLR